MIVQKIYRLAVVVLLIINANLALAAETSLQELIVENHFEYIPTGPGPFPTLIAMPGSSGIANIDPNIEAANPKLREGDLLFRGHYRKASEKLREAGYAVLLIDVHSAEGLLTAHDNQLSEARMAEYIDTAIAWARELPFVDTNNINLIGWSMGGRAVLAWLHGPRSQADIVKSVIGVYPGCEDKKELNNDVPLLMLLGDADDIASADVCETFAKSSTKMTNLTYFRFPDARHGFDIEDAPPVLVEDSGKTIGYNKNAADSTWQEIFNFLSKD